MKERPILFSAPMVRAILDGRKTQTRRVAPIESLDLRPISDQMVAWNVRFSKAIKGVLGTNSGGKFTDLQARSIIASQFNPYGQPGDRLWVRETWARDDEDGQMMYRADLGRDVCADAWEQGRIEGVSRYRWRPSIHMPRWASRMTLEITAVRVERLQDISETDAKAEGADPYRLPVHPDLEQLRHVDGYHAIWETINGPHSWDKNPWVWVIEFKRV